MLDQLFEALKLTAKERKIVQLLIDRGPQRASTLASACDLPRNTARGVLDKLVGNGLLNRTRRGNTHYYAVEKPANIKLAIETRREELLSDVEHQLRVLERSESELEGPRAMSARRPQVTFYDGYEGLRRVYEDTLGSSEELRSWGSFDANQTALPNYFRNYYKRRARRGVHIRSIHPDTPLAQAHRKRDRAELRQSQLVPKEKFNLTPEIQVYDNKVNIVSYRDRIGIIIESDEIAGAMKAIFDLSWDRSTTRKGKH